MPRKEDHKPGNIEEVDPGYFCKKVSENVRRLRMEMGFTQENLAFDMNVSKQFIQKIEGGKRNITLQTLLKLSVHLKTTPSALIDVL